MLAAGALGAEHVDAQILVVDLDVDFLGLGQHRDRGRRGVDAPARFGLRHALHAVHARFELEPREHVAAGDRGHRLLDAAEPGLVEIEGLEAPALPCGIALVHAEQLGREQRRLLAAGAGAHLEDGVARVGLVLGQQHQLHGALGPRELLLEAAILLVGEGAHLGIDRGVVLHGGGLVDPVLQDAQALDGADHRVELGQFLRHLDDALRIDAGAGELGRDFGVAGEDAIECGFQIHGIT